MRLRCGIADWKQLSISHITLLEKLVTMMEKIVHRLPAYREHLRFLRERSEKLAGATDSTMIDDRSRLAISLSYVFVDVVQFCQSACNMFATKATGEWNTCFDTYMIDTYQEFNSRLDLSGIYSGLPLIQDSATF